MLLCIEKGAFPGYVFGVLRDRLVRGGEEKTMRSSGRGTKPPESCSITQLQHGQYNLDDKNVACYQQQLGGWLARVACWEGTSVWLNVKVDHIASEKIFVDLRRRQVVVKIKIRRRKTIILLDRHLGRLAANSSLDIPIGSASFRWRMRGSSIESDRGEQLKIIDEVELQIGAVVWQCWLEG